MLNHPETALKYPYVKPEISARIKSIPEDFRVMENLGFELTGAGEHLFLYIQKKLHFQCYRLFKIDSVLPCIISFLQYEIMQ